MKIRKRKITPVVGKEYLTEQGIIKYYRESDILGSEATIGGFNVVDLIYIECYLDNENLQNNEIKCTVDLQLELLNKLNQGIEDINDKEVEVLPLLDKIDDVYVEIGRIAIPGLYKPTLFTKDYKMAIIPRF